MSVEAPERIWVERDPDTGEKRWFSIKGMGDTEYVRADKLAELAAENERWRERVEANNEWRKAYNELTVKTEAALAERDKEIAALREALEFYENPKVYEPHPHGPAFDGGRDISFVARNALACNAGGNNGE